MLITTPTKKIYIVIQVTVDVFGHCVYVMSNFWIYRIIMYAVFNKKLFCIEFSCTCMIKTKLKL